MTSIKIKFPQDELFRRAALVLDIPQRWVVSAFPSEGGRVFYVVYWGKRYRYGKVEESRTITIWELIEAAPLSDLKGEVASVWTRGVESLLEILGLKSVPKTERDLKQAYRSVAKKIHPDQGGDVQAFREARAAYESLQVHVRFKN